MITKSRSPSPNLGFPGLNKAHLQGLTHEGEDTMEVPVHLGLCLILN
jgi:hypothetical protein